MKRLLASAALTVALVAGGVTLYNAQNTTGQSFATAVAQTATTDGDAIDTSSIVEMALGAKDAPITIVEYASFTCPHCATFHENVLPEIEQNYVDTGKVRFVFREAYFDKFGLWASLMARCGGEMRYFGISDILMKTQGDWLAGGDSAKVVENLRRIGLTAGMTEESLDACFNDSEKVQSLVTWYQDNFTRDEMNSTPSFLINGKKYSNMNYADFSAVLDALE